ncbi:hypothetical protein [Spirosoma rhododendri]|uniref:Uncharacterized protein n=1 Tax=Spirosoma rhododendri TaxID=2728024 RepID=A0A7L5DY17_9BACT|nr:hypothetical protein [Spirosoma rhododendri]QJD81528.1 hypothetical protein HH216_24465 [Spirosoma rhododendri]
MNKGLRATIGTHDISGGFVNLSNPHNNIGTGVADAIEIIKEYNSMLRDISEVGRLVELTNLKNYLEQRLPSGQEAQLYVSDFQVGKGFNEVRVIAVNQYSIVNDDKVTLQRPMIIKLIGKADNFSTHQSIRARPTSISMSNEVNSFNSPQQQKTNSREDGIRIEPRRIDHMGKAERDFYEHPDRRIA